VVKQGIIRKIVSLKRLKNQRDLIVPLLQRQKPPLKKESTGTHADHDVWLIDSVASYHMTPHREWLYEYEKYDGGDVFLRDDSTKKIMGRGRVKLLLKYGRIRTLPGVLHIPKLARSLISVSKLDDAGVNTVFGKNTCKMV
jgi:hypothetical protein